MNPRQILSMSIIDSKDIERLNYSEWFLEETSGFGASVCHGLML